MSGNMDNILESKEIQGKIFLLYGDEKYLKDKYINKIKKCFPELSQGINYIKFNDDNLYSLPMEINTPPFGYESKLIIVNDSKLFKITRKKKADLDNESDDENSNVEDVEADNSKNSELEKELLNILDSGIPEYTTIIFNETDIAKTKKIYKQIENIGYVKECKKLKENELVTYVVELVSKYNVKISKENATYFVSICSKNLEDIINELRKLIDYTGVGNEIKKEYIDKITTKELDAIIFDLTDYLGKKQLNKSIETLNELILQKEPIQKIYIMLYRHIKNLYLLKYSSENGLNAEETLGLHPFVILKAKDQIKNFTLQELKDTYIEFMQLDILYKNGNIDLYNGIINVISNIKK